MRLRPGLIFKRGAATGIRRLFAGPLLPSPLVRPGLVFVIPDLPGLAVQAVHADDVADAYRLAVIDDTARRRRRSTRRPRATLRVREFFTGVGRRTNL